MNRRKFLSYVGCGCCGLILNSCATAPITERRQLKIIPESKLNAQAAAIFEKVKERELKLGHKIPDEINIGAMLETPSLAFSSDDFFKQVDFLSIGGNDLKQFFFAADRENELVRKRYDTLNLSFLDFLKTVVEKCEKNSTKLSFCGEDAGRPVEALCLAAIGIKTLSMRPASIGPVKNILLKSDLGEVRKIIEKAKVDGETTLRKKVIEYVAKN